MIPLFRLKISKPTHRVTVTVDTDIFDCDVRAADEGSDTPSVEDAIKITTNDLSAVGVLVVGSFDLTSRRSSKSPPGTR